MADESRVFDVSKPSRVSPPATSRPVIVGHHPMTNDPMVRSGEHEATKIPINITPPADDPALDDQAHRQPDKAHDQDSPAIFSDPDDAEAPADNVSHTESVGEGPFTAAQPQPEVFPEPVLPDEPAAPDTPDTADIDHEPINEVPHPNDHPAPHIEGLHFAQPPRRGGRLKYALLGLLILLIAAYLAIDSGVIKTSFKMPFHIFSQKTSPAVSNSTTAPKKPVSTAPAVPAGFKLYNLTGTDLAFAAPLSWGDPTSTPDPGYTKRGGTNQSDGTYAYIVSFASNKDIQIAVTSDKYLPAARATLYYDYLQWCTGTADGKIYESVLSFSTVDKVDTPTTVTCNQGPVAATKIDSSTVVQTKAADPTGKVIGDIYIKNVDDPTWVVFRVKDAAMTNSSDIEQLLKTVKVTTTQSATSGNSAGQQ